MPSSGQPNDFSSGIWASSGGYDVRIVFRFIQTADAEMIALLSIGTHDEIY
jgi:mRNA-degrading endonuclease YafQ of YafQ-DinJ toxin-antitoxin module